MPRRAQYTPLTVYINGRVVGTLRRSTSGAISFQYYPEWLNWSSAFPASLSLPLREQPYVGAPVIAVFENLLPDNDEIRRRIAARVGAASISAFDLLTSIGRDCVGAMQFLPKGEEPDSTADIRGKALSTKQISEILQNVAIAPLGNTETEEFRISIAGAQEKTALLRKNGKWYRPTGSTPTTHIFKLPLGMLPNGIDLTDSVENEYLCLKFVRALGLPVPDAEIMTFGNRKALVVERFDRKLTTDKRLLRLPQEDLCQALSVSPVRKYEADGGPGMKRVLQLLKGSDNPLSDQAVFLRSNIVFWLIGATDGHAKNFSIRILPQGRFELTPIYDVLSAQPAVSARKLGLNKYKLAMSVGKNKHYVINRIAPRHFVQSAESSGLASKMVIKIFEELIDTAEKAIERETGNLPAGVQAALADCIISGFKHRLKIIMMSREMKR